MVTLHRRANWKIAVYGGEHGIPHFHIEGRDFRASVGIKTREVIIGSAPRAVLAAALAWAETNEAELQTTWAELNE